MDNMVVALKDLVDTIVPEECQDDWTISLSYSKSDSEATLLEVESLRGSVCNASARKLAKSKPYLFVDSLPAPSTAACLLLKRLKSGLWFSVAVA